MVRTLWAGFVFAVSTAVISCAPVHYERVIDPIGPVAPVPFTPPTPESGRLVVYTDTEEFDRGGDYYHPHTPYTIYTLNGERVRWVANRSDVEDESPDRVTLTAGGYKIRARGLGRWVEVVVRIEPGQTTSVYLDGSWTPPPGAPAETVVQGVDGTPVGWRAGPLDRKHSPCPVLPVSS